MRRWDCIVEAPLALLPGPTEMDEPVKKTTDRCCPVETEKAMVIIITVCFIIVRTNCRSCPGNRAEKANGEGAMATRPSQFFNHRFCQDCRGGEMMKTIRIEDATYYVMNEVTLPEGRIRLTLVPVHATGVYTVCRNADGNYSDWKDYPQSRREDALS